MNMRRVSLNNLQFAILLSVLACLSLHAEPAADTPEPEKKERLKEMTLSEAAQKEVNKYMNLILEDPRNEFAFEQVYRIYESEKKTWKLLDFFINAARLQRTNGKLQVLLGMTYYRFRDYYKAAEHFRGALKLLPNDFYSHLMLGRVYLKQSSTAKAKGQFAEAVKVASGIDDRVNALLLLGESLMLEDSPEEAQKAWSEILQIQRYDIPTLQKLSRIYRKHDFLDKSDKMLAEVLELSKKNPRLTCDTHLERADLQLQKGDRDKAVEYLRQAQAVLHPESPLRQEVEVRIRELYSEGDKLDQFFQELAQKIEDRPFDTGLRKEIARHFNDVGREAEALPHVEHALKIDDRDVPLLEQASALLVKLKQPDSSIEKLDRLYEITGGAPSYLVRRGDIQWEQEQKDEALATWRQIVESAPSLRRYRSVTRAYRRHDVQDEAIASYRKMLEIDPKAQDARLEFADYLLSLAAEQAKLANEAEAAEDADKAASAKVKSEERKKEASEMLGALTEAEDASSTVFLQVAELFERYEMDEPLLVLLKEASGRFDKDYRLLKGLGLVQERLQNYDEAIAAFFNAYDNAPSWRESQVLMDKLISLHLAYGKSTNDERHRGGRTGLGHLILRLYRDIKTDPESPEPYMGLARIAAVSRPTAKSGFRAPPINVEGLAKYSEVKTNLFPMGPMNAISFYTQALDRAPMRLDAYEGLSRGFMLFDEFERAVMEYKKLAIVNPVGKWKYYFAIGDFFASQGQMPEARAFWNRVAERAFTDATLYFRLGTRYYWAERTDQAFEMLRKAIDLHPDEYRYHLALGNILADQKKFAEAIHEYREALKLSTQTMLLPVRRTMSEVQINFAHELYTQGKYKESLDVYEEVNRFQEVLNKHLGTTVPEYPDILVQILRTKAKLNGSDQPDLNVYRKISGKFPDATCWISDQLRMSIDYFVEQELKGFKPMLIPELAKSNRKLPSVALGYAVRLHPWILHIALSPNRLNLAGKYKEETLDPRTGRKVGKSERKGFIKYFGKHALRAKGWYELSETSVGQLRRNPTTAPIAAKLASLIGKGTDSRETFQKMVEQALSPEEFKGYWRWATTNGTIRKVVLSEIDTGKVIWEARRAWSHDFKANSQVAVAIGRGRGARLEALDLKTGELLWNAPGCQKFEVNEKYVTLKRMKSGKRASRGGLSLEEAAYGDSESIGYVFQALDARTGKVLWERQSQGTHYWRVPIAVDDEVLLVDGFAHTVFAYSIPTGKLLWQAQFESFFAAPPWIIDGRIYLYMRLPKKKTIIQYVLNPDTGEIIHQTDMQVNSLYAKPAIIDKTLFYYDPVAYSLLGIDREIGGVTGRQPVAKWLTTVSKRNVVTFEGQGKSIYFYSWDGLVLKLDVGSQ